MRKKLSHLKKNKIRKIKTSQKRANLPGKGSSLGEARGQIHDKNVKNIQRKKQIYEEILTSSEEQVSEEDSTRHAGIKKQNMSEADCRSVQ